MAFLMSLVEGKMDELLKLLFAAAVVLAAGCQETPEPAPVTDAEALTAALEAAELGDVVRLGVCHVAGNFVVPDGVTLVGAGAGQSVIDSDERAAVMVIGDIGMPRVADLSIVSGGAAGLVVMGEGSGGSAEIEGVTIEATLGVGLAAEALAELTLNDVTISGPVTPTNVNRLPIIDGVDLETAATMTATHGLVLNEVEAAELTDVEVSGFASLGALLIESGTTWRGGGAAGNLLTGLGAVGGEATFEDVALTGTLQGMRATPASNAVFVGGVTVESTGLTIADSAGYGLLHNGITAHHVDLVAEDNADTALWAQGCPELELSGTGTRMTGNAFAGVVAVDSTDVTIQGAQIDGTRLAPRMFEEGGTVNAGDGVQLVDPVGTVNVEDVSFTGNERVGLLIDLGGASMESLTIRDVEVDGTGDELGAVAQGAEPPAGWDAEVTRAGVTAENDATHTEALSVAETIDVATDAFDLSSQGIASVIGDIGAPGR